ncbi:MAG TPA: hypothetical protein VIL71_02185 [Spirillospora sp.]
MTPRDRTSRDRVALSAGRGLRARWVGRRLFAEAERGDGPDAGAARRDIARIALTPGHRLRERAREAVAVWWVRDRDPELRDVVLKTRALAPAPPERFVTLALQRRLYECGPLDAPNIAGLLGDPDPDVRERAFAFCREASGPTLHWLWTSVPGPLPGTPLRAALLANDRPAPLGLLDDLWAEWLKTPSEELGAALLRWRRPARADDLEPLSVVALKTPREIVTEPRHRAALIEALTFGDHPLYAIAEQKVLGSEHHGLIEELCAEAMHRPDLARFCRRHRLAPEDPVKRALFFVVTGQPEQYRAIDPDGSLLSLAYASASSRDRARLQEVMVGAGDLDLVRVIVGDDRRARIPAMNLGEIRYLGEQLAARREWEELWALVQDVSIVSGTDLIGLFDGWVPRGDDARRIFEMYLETDRHSVEAALRHFPSGGMPLWRQAKLLFRGRVNDVSFAPDGPYLAVAGSERVAGVFDLRTGGLVERYTGFASSVGRVLHLGDATLVAGERTNRNDRECKVVLCADGGARTLHTTRGSVTSLAAMDESGSFAAATRAGDVVLVGPGGEPVTAVPVRSLRLSGRWPRAIAAHPASRRIAVLSRGLSVAETAAAEAAERRSRTAKPFTVIGQASDVTMEQVAFVDADTLVCAARHGDVKLVRQSGAGLMEIARTVVAKLGGLAASPATGEAVIADRSGRVTVYDGATLEPRESHTSETSHGYTGATISPTGDFLAVGDAAGHADLFDLRVREMPEILRRPLVDLVPRHLGIVGSVLASCPRPVKAALQLLHACLEHRFRFDIEIGDAVQLTAGEYDISL